MNRLTLSILIILVGISHISFSQGDYYIRSEEQNGVLYLWTGLHWHTTGAIFNNSGEVFISSSLVGDGSFQINPIDGQNVTVLSSTSIEFEPGTELVLDEGSTSSMYFGIGTSREVCFSSEQLMDIDYTIFDGINELGPFNSKEMASSVQCYNALINNTSNEAELYITTIENTSSESKEITISLDDANNYFIQIDNYLVSERLYNVIDNAVYFTGTNPIKAEYAFYVTGFNRAPLLSSSERLTVRIKKNNEIVPINASMGLSLEIYNSNNTLAYNSTEISSEGSLIWNAVSSESGSYTYKVLKGSDLVLKGSVVKR